MTFQDPWNSAYEAIPADTENTNLGANRIRDLKVNVRERANVDHSWGDTADNGMHNKVSFNLSTTDPPSSASNSFLYSKEPTNSTNMELFYEDNAGRVVQLTSNGAIDFPPQVPAGTRLLFPQPTPPPGWNFIPGWNDRVIRMVDDGTGGQAGGGWTITGLSAFSALGTLNASSTSTGTGFGSFSGSTDGHALATSEIPPHTHNLTLANIQDSATGSGGDPTPAFQYHGGTQVLTTDTGTVGGGVHSHTYSGTVSVGLTISTSTTLSGAPSVSVGADGTWRPAYGNAILGQKA